MEDKLYRYEELKQIEGDIKAELKEVGDEILEEMNRQNVDSSPELKEGRIDRVIRRGWQYSEDVKETIKELQANARSEGGAIRVESAYLKYVPKKEKPADPDPFGPF